MYKVFVSAVILAAFSLVFSELYSPEVWYGFRSDTLSFGAGVRNDDIGETVYYELIQKNPEGKSTLLFSKSIKPSKDETEYSLEFLGIKKDIVGKDALWIKETIGKNTDESKIYGPYGFIKTPLIETSDTAILFDGEAKNFLLPVGEKYKFTHNKNGLIIALGDLENDISFSIDAANSKTAFLAFANRIITFKAEEKTVSFFYPERNIEKTAAIQYKVRDWEGKMVIFDTANGKVIFIPWFDLGIKYEDGRIIGYMINGNNFSYPANASQYSPSSWGNLILK